MESEPLLSLQIRGEEVLAHRWNTSLYAYMGELAAYNHIFIAHEETEEGRTLGSYLFQSNPQYAPTVAFVQAQNFPQHINLTEVAECDERVFDYVHYRKSREDESFPDEWLRNDDV